MPTIGQIIVNQEHEINPSAWDELNKLLANKWRIMDMYTVDNAHFDVFIKEKDKNQKVERNLK